MPCAAAPAALTAAVLSLLLAGAPTGAEVLVTEGPTVLHANAAVQWGGHTYSYLLQGEKFLFWTATQNTWDDKDNGKRRYMTQLVGQFPLPGTRGEPRVHIFEVDGPRAFASLQPQLFRTPDGYLHMLCGLYRRTDVETYLPGSFRYYRSARPEDVTEWVDRTACLPKTPFADFHLRMNVGVSRDGTRAAIAVLGVSLDGSVSGNTPIIFFGRRDGLDFRFTKGIAYHKPMGFFYPQVAVVDDGVVLLGEVWDVADHATSLLVHLDWRGKILHEEALPSVDGKGYSVSLDMRPLSWPSRDRLVIYHNLWSADPGTRFAHQFFIYDVKARRLRLEREIPTDGAHINQGKWLAISEGRSAFLQNPQQGRFVAHEGALLGSGELVTYPLPRTDPLPLGYVNTGYAMVPNPLQGSVVTPGISYLMSDCSHRCRDMTQRGPCSLLLWRLSLQP